MPNPMTVAEAQQEMRAVYLDGALGQAVAGVIWLLSALTASALSPRAGILMLVFGGMAIFPATQVILLAMGRPASVSPANPLRPLAPQVALVAPLLMPLAGAATLHRLAWFYPAFMIIIGAHYLPFAFLYGRRAFLVLAAGLVGGGVALGVMDQAPFVLGGWVTGGGLIAFAGLSLMARPAGST